MGQGQVGDQIYHYSTIFTKLYGDGFLCVDMLDVSGYHLFIIIKLLLTIEHFIKVEIISSKKYHPITKFKY